MSKHSSPFRRRQGRGCRGGVPPDAWLAEPWHRNKRYGGQDEARETCVGTSAQPKIGERFVSDVRREDEESDANDARCSLFSFSFACSALPKSPEQSCPGNRLDDAVKTKSYESDAARQVAGRNCNQGFEGVPTDRKVFE